MTVLLPGVWMNKGVAIDSASSVQRNPLFLPWIVSIKLYS